MPHIRIHGLASGDGEERGTEHGEPHQGRRMDDEGQCGDGADGGQNVGCEDDASSAENPKHNEPGEHDGAKQATDESAASSLNEEEAD